MTAKYDKSFSHLCLWLFPVGTATVLVGTSAAPLFAYPKVTAPQTRVQFSLPLLFCQFYHAEIT